MAQFARPSSIEHVRIRYVAAPPVTGPALGWKDPNQNGTTYALVHAKGFPIRLAITQQSNAPLAQLTVSFDPGPYAITRDGVSERVLQQEAIDTPVAQVREKTKNTRPISDREAQGQVVRPRNAKGQFVSTATLKAGKSVTGQAPGSRVNIGPGRGTRVKTKKT